MGDKRWPMTVKGQGPGQGGAVGSLTRERDSLRRELADLRALYAEVRDQAERDAEEVHRLHNDPAAWPTGEEPPQLAAIRQWEAGELHPEHDTFSFGHGFGTALVQAFDHLQLRCQLAEGVRGQADPDQAVWDFLDGQRG